MLMFLRKRSRGKRAYIRQYSTLGLHLLFRSGLSNFKVKFYIALSLRIQDGGIERLLDEEQLSNIIPYFGTFDECLLKQVNKLLKK